MPITFGAVGDIISVCILVKDCVEALSETNGSKAQYRAVIQELTILEKAVLEIAVLWRTHATTPELASIFANANTTVDQCRASLESFKLKAQPYERRLGKSSNDNMLQKVCNGNARKLLWQVRMKDEVARFRAEVVAYSVSIDQILAAATMHTVKAQGDRLDGRMKRLQRDSSCAFAQQDKLLKEIRSRPDAVDKCILASSSLLVKTVKKARQTWFLQLGQELKTLLFKTLAMNLVIYTSVERVQSSILDLRQALPTPNSLVTPLTHERIFYLRDAIGRESSITLNFITSYDALTAVLQVRFHGMPGLKKIIKNEFAIENRATGKDMDRNMPWECFFRPGLWFDMDMIFQTVLDEGSESPIEDTCPSCNAKSNQSQGLRIKCSVCKQEYRYDRTGELTTENIDSSAEATHTHVPEAPDSSFHAPPTLLRPIIHPVPPSRPTKRKRESDPDEDPANFNHVRIKIKKRPLNQKEKEMARDAAKRKCDTAMDIDHEKTTPKRPKFDEMEIDGEEKTKHNKTSDAQKKEQETGTNWSASPTDFNFNEATGNQTPSSFLFASNQPIQAQLDKDDSTPSTISIWKTPKDDDSHDHRAQDIKQHVQYGLAGHDTLDAKPSTPTSEQQLVPKPGTDSPSLAVTKSAKRYKAVPQKATEEDARKAGIPSGYSLKNWDPTEEPIMLLGSVFDANSMGKWIYDWTVFYYGPTTPLAEMAGELWLLLIQLAGKVKRAEETMPKIRNIESHEMVEDFLESGVRLWYRFAKLLKICEGFMLKAAKKESGENKLVSMGKNSASEFLDSIFGRDRELERTEKLMTGMRLWSMRFDANCNDILRYPGA